MSELRISAADYVRSVSDEDLLFRLGITLALKQRAASRVVRVGVENGVVRLAGAVPSFYDRRLIALITRHVAGVVRVEDELTVVDAHAQQQAADPDSNSDHSSSKPNSRTWKNQFLHLPVLSETLEDMLARRESDAGLSQ